MKLGPRQRKLIAFLRSGQVTQACGRLEMGGCFCVLGALCKHYEDETGNELQRRRYHSPRDEMRLIGTDLGSHDEVREYFGLRNGDGDPEEGEDVIRKHLLSVTGQEPCFLDLISLNDNYTLSFNTFADLLEAYGKFYFEEPK